MDSLELVLDESSDAFVRTQWTRLREAGLPGQDPDDRPHVTLAVRDAIDPEHEPALREVTARLPIPIRLGALAVFGRTRFILVRLVVPNATLLELQGRVTAALGPEPPPGHDLLESGRWTPHVTLGRRLTPDQVATAVDVLSGGPEIVEGAATGCRRWDEDTRTERWVSGG